LDPTPFLKSIAEILGPPEIDHGAAIFMEGFGEEHEIVEGIFVGAVVAAYL
jgi:hypothetical protein